MTDKGIKLLTKGKPMVVPGKDKLEFENAENDPVCLMSVEIN